MGDDIAVLVEGVLAGNRECEAQLVERFSPALMVLLRVRTGNPALAEDLHQETFRIAIENIRAGKLRNLAGAGAYLRQIAINLIKANYRRQFTHKTETNSDLVQLTIDSNTSPLNGLRESELSKMVQEVLQQLPVARDREIIQRFYFREESKQRICEEYALTAAHFDRVIYRARQRMRKLLEAAGHSIEVVNQ